ncbi:hypothetical protein GCM10010124_07990 [Pilimelia terevasa]|uniref:Right handed beta helix domain-containing protein n=1 Tax=Pilimelia terevasa TaxID=53372 RepID=A0A8J3BJ06_9ACTN|nr:right-handed parallel beta-helix repeat-containing protein [Pilimelia terevasa]GGK17825.1 hypothetical protein GCM10010124_07990 [Pilimelia terevasa]
MSARHRLSWAAGAAVVVLAGTAGVAAVRGGTPGASPAPVAATPTADPPGAACPAPTRTARDAGDLQTAVDAARPGDSVRLADGVHPGRLVVRVSGTAAAPIHICGGPAAVLDGSGTGSGYVVHLDGAAHVRLVGLTVRNGLKGVVADRTRFAQLRALTVERTGDEGIRLREFSTDNLVVDSVVRATGLRHPEFGEGVYIGSAQTQWCAVSGCAPDASDRNVVRDNRIAQTAAEAVDVKEGTTAGQILGNTFDGARLAGAYADSWVDVKGNGWTVAGNRGRRSRGDGFQTHEILPGWGRDNVFSANVAEVAGPGFGFRLTPASTNRVTCDNTVTGAARGVANIPCADTPPPRAT